MAEEHGFQASEGGHRLCVNNCGFFGSAATQNMCPKCYGETCLQKSDDRTLTSTPLTSAPAPPQSSSTVAAEQVTVQIVTSLEKVEPTAVAAVVTVMPPRQSSANRCWLCRKKVGLTGFKCKCGPTFCGIHRYPEKHECNFDFKAVGREAIAKANPLIRAVKLEKI